MPPLLAAVPPTPTRAADRARAAHRGELIYNSRANAGFTQPFAEKYPLVFFNFQRSLYSSSGGGGRGRQGWVLNEDGTWVRGSASSSSSHSSETHYGAGYDGYGGNNQVNLGGGRGGSEDGDVGHNTTG